MKAKVIFKNVIYRIIYAVCLIVLMEIIRRLMGASDSLVITWQEALIFIAVAIVASIIEDIIRTIIKNKKKNRNESDETYGKK